MATTFDYTLTVPKNFQFGLERKKAQRPAAIPTLPHFRLEARVNELKSKIQSLASQICPEKSIEAIIEPFSRGAHKFNEVTYALSLRPPFLETETSSKIGLPSYFLLKPEDIPLEFKVQDVNDPRLDDDNFLKSFSDWINAVNKKYGLPLIDGSKDLEALREFIVSLRNPDLYEKMKDFIMGHELNHAVDENESVFLALENKENTYAFTIGIIVGAAILVLSLGLIPFVTLPVILGLACFGVALSATSYLVLRHGFAKCVEIEKTCDMGAAEALKDVSGGIYYFENTCLRNLHRRNNDPSLSRCFDEKGNCITDFYHPDLTTRIEYLQKWQAEHTS